MIKIGNSNVVAAYIGTTPLAQITKGNLPIWLPTDTSLKILSGITEGLNDYTIRLDNKAADLTTAPFVIGVGSSSMAGTGASSPSTTSYMAKLNTWLTGLTGNARVLNAGKSGLATANLMMSLGGTEENRSIDMAVAARPTAIVIDLPSNDAANNVTAETFANNIIAMFNMAKSAGIPCFVMSPGPRNTLTNPQKLRQLEALELIKQGIPSNFYIDQFNPLLKVGTLCDIADAYNSDGIHVNDAGHDVKYNLLQSAMFYYFQDRGYLEYSVERGIVSQIGGTPSSWTVVDTVTDYSNMNKTYARVDSQTYAHRVRGKRSNGTYTPYSEVLYTYQPHDRLIVDKTWQVDFSLNTATAPPVGWNNLAPTTAGPALNTVYDLVDSTGADTDATLTVTKVFSGAGIGGAASGGIYPNAVISDRWFISSTSLPAAQIKISNLDPNRAYNLDFLSSNNHSLLTRYLILKSGRYGGSQNAVTAVNTPNMTNLIKMQGIKANGSGDIVIDVFGMEIGYLTAMVINEYQPGTPLPTTTTTTSTTTTGTTSTTTTFPLDFGDTIPTAQDSVLAFAGKPTWGSNLGYYSNGSGTNWSDQNLVGLIADVKGNTVRTALTSNFLETFGYTIRLSAFQSYVTDHGMTDITTFLGEPVAAHRDTVTYGDSPEPSKLFRNMYEPIWNPDNSLNTNNYAALYIYNVIQTYGEFIKFWEIVNEPDFTYGPNTVGQWLTRAPYPEEMANLYAPIYHYIRFLRIAWEVTKTYAPNTYVTVGGIGYYEFLDAVCRYTDNPVDGSVNSQYKKLGGAYIDVLSYHVYPIYSMVHYDVPSGDFVFDRHTDFAAETLVHHQEEMNAVLEARGYDGVTYPRKHFIMTETNMPRRTCLSITSSDAIQRSFALKALALSQTVGIKSFHFYMIGEAMNAPSEGTSITEQEGYALMGLYKNLTTATPGTEEMTDEGIAFKTWGTIFEGFEYDAEHTSQMYPLVGIGGIAMKNDADEYAYILWAKTTTDNDESNTATFSFPSGFGITSVRRYEWNYSTTATSSVISSSNINLTSTPSFFTVEVTTPTTTSTTTTAPVTTTTTSTTTTLEESMASTWTVQSGSGNAWHPTTTSQQMRVYTPSTYNDGNSNDYPTIIFLHGSGQNGTSISTILGDGLPQLINGGQSMNSLVFAPQNPGSTWDPTEVAAAVAWAKANYRVDDDRVYITGLSLGATGTWDYVKANPTVAAAYAVAAGTYTLTTADTNIKDLPAYFAHGATDVTQNTNNTTNAVSKLNNLSPKPFLAPLVSIIKDQAHNATVWNTNFYSKAAAPFDLEKWLLLHSRVPQDQATNYVTYVENMITAGDEDKAFFWYPRAKKQVDALSAGSPKTALLVRCADIETALNADRRFVMDLGTGSVTGYNSLNNGATGQSLSNLTDTVGGSSSVGFNVVLTSAYNMTPRENSVTSMANENFGMPTGVSNDYFTTYYTGGTYKFTGLNNAKTYRLIVTGIRDHESGIHQRETAIQIGTTVRYQFQNLNTLGYITFDSLTPTSGEISFSVKGSPTSITGSATVLPNYVKQLNASQIGGYNTNQNTAGGVSIIVLVEEGTPAATTTTSTTTTAAPTTTTTSTTSTTTTLPGATTTTSTTSTTTTVASGIPAGPVAKFHFSETPVTVSDWVNVVGDPNDAVRTATDTRNGSVSISTVNTALWVPIGAQTTCASNTGGENTADAVFPALVNRGYIYTWVVPHTNVNIRVSGLEPGVLYTVQIRACRDDEGVPLTNRYMDMLCVDANGSQRIEDIDVKGNISTTVRTPGTAAGPGIGTFVNRQADASGNLDFIMTPPSPSNANYPYAYINGIIITKE